MSVDVEQLTRDHKKAISTIDGIEFHSVPSLLSQLRESIYNGGAPDGARMGAQAKLPIQAAALDLYMKIDRQITDAWVDVFHRVPGTDTPERLLSEWAAFVQNDTLVTVDGRQVYATDAVAGWIRMISDYFDPPRLAEIKAACIGCGEKYVYRKVDGENVRSTALKFLRDRDTGETIDARCEACGRVWQPSQFKFLLEQIAKLEKAERVVASFDDTPGAQHVAVSSDL